MIWDDEFVEKLDWKSALAAFLEPKVLSGVSMSTIEWYEVTFRLFHRFHRERHLECTPLTCTSQHIQEFLGWLAQWERSITVHTKFRALRAFFRWLQREGIRKDNPIEKVIPPRIDDSLPKTVTEEHFIATMQTLNLSNFTALRDAALFALAFDSGARLSELLNLKISDIDMANRSAIVRGKGKKERIVYFGYTTGQLLMRYLSQRMLRFGMIPKDAPLFIRIDGFKISKAQVEKRWQIAQLKAGLKPLPFHGLRHGFARMWLLKGGDSFSLQMLLGHSSAETTKRYVTLWASDLRKLHAERSPVDSLPMPIWPRRSRVKRNGLY